MKYYITKADEMVEMKMEKPEYDDFLASDTGNIYWEAYKKAEQKWLEHLTYLTPVNHRLPNKVGDIVEEGKDFEWEYQVVLIRSNIDVWRICSRREYENSLEGCRRKVAIPKDEKPVEAASKDGCPCNYLDEPCHPKCTCVNRLSSVGCRYCAKYGSIEQRKEAALRIKNKIESNTLHC